MSAVDDFAEIARRLREKQGLPKPVAAPQQAVPNQPSNPGQQYQQAAQGMLPCSLCDDAGWIGVMRRSMWTGYQCPVCGNPRRKKNPI